MVAWLNYAIGAFALISIGGGLQGFLAKGSIQSFAAGAGSGVLLLIGLFISKKNAKVAYILTALLCVAVGSMMLMRFIKGDKDGNHGFWPAGVMGIGGLVLVAAHVVAHFQSPRSK